MVEFVPADFRRFALVAERGKPRVMATVADADRRSTARSACRSHAGATVDELHRAGADPDRLLVVESEHPSPAHVRLRRRITLTRSTSTRSTCSSKATAEPFVIADPPATPTSSEAIARNAMRVHSRRRDAPDRDRWRSRSRSSSLLADGPGGDYGVHSEMFTTGLMRLHEAGKVTNANKGINEGVSVCTFAPVPGSSTTGSTAIVDVRFLPVQLVNDPAIIAANNGMVTINGALAVDLLGQVAADTIGRTQYSGIGGHEDFVAMSGFQLEDRALVCLPSTATVKGEPVSRITVDLPTGRRGHHAAASDRRRDHRVRCGRTCRVHGKAARPRAGGDRAPGLPCRPACGGGDAQLTAGVNCKGQPTRKGRCPMFVQFVKVPVSDVAGFADLENRWVAELRPGATGFLGSTSGVTANGEIVGLSRWESAAAAQANSARPEQDAWWQDMMKVVDGEPELKETENVAVLFENGCDNAGFVQIMEGTGDERASARSRSAFPRPGGRPTSRPSRRVSRLLRRRHLRRHRLLHERGRRARRRVAADAAGSRTAHDELGATVSHMTYHDISAPSIL